MKFIISLCLVLLALQQSKSAPFEAKKQMQSIIGSIFGGTKNEEIIEIVELDWNTIKFDEIKLNTQEIEIQPSELYKKVLDCIKKCMENMPTNSYRDKCLAKTCDIY